MKFRWTIKELEESSDEKIIRGILAERMSELNVYAPLCVRLSAIYQKMNDIVQEQEKKMRTVVLNENDFRTIDNGYHLDGWAMIKESLGLAPDVEEVEVCVASTIEKTDYKLIVFERDESGRGCLINLYYDGKNMVKEEKTFDDGLTNNIFCHVDDFNPDAYRKGKEFLELIGHNVD